MYLVSVYFRIESY